MTMALRTSIEVLELFDEAAQLRGHGRSSLHLPFAFGELSIRRVRVDTTKAERNRRFYLRLKADPQRYTEHLARSAANCRDYYRREADNAGRHRVRCGACGTLGHNRRSCSRVPTPEQLRARHREYHARYRERHRESVRARQAAWDLTRRVRVRATLTKGVGR